MQHYADLPDIKRVVVNTHAIEPQVRRGPFLCGAVALAGYTSNANSFMG